MKRILFLGIAASALLLSNCSNEDLEGRKTAAQGNKNVITASFEACKNGPVTRTTVGENNVILWTEKDAFNLFYTDESGSSRYTINPSDAGNPSASFEGSSDPSKTPKYAVFPAQTGMTISSSILNMELPSSITWTGNSNGPMLAEVKEGKVENGVYFNHLAALLKVVINNMPEGAAAFKITSSENIAGPCTADLDVVDKPVLVVSEGSEAKKEIIVSFPAITSSEANKERVFFVPLPVTSYKWLAISLTNSDGSIIYFEKTKFNFSLGRADFLVATIDQTTINATTPSGVNAALNDGNLEKTIQNATNGNVPVNIALTETINTTQGSNDPLQLPMVDNAQLNMTFKEAPTTTTDQPLTIKEKTTATGANALTVAIPSVADDKAPSITVDLPKTTVTLATTDAQTTYNKVVATTAENTLIVDKGVTVKELVIKGGNVKIYGTVEKLSRDVANQAQSTIVEVYDAGDIRVIDGIESFAINSVWDGAVHSEITLPEISNGSIPIYTAAQFATLQSKNIPAKVPAGGLPFTVKENVSLHTDIDLKENPWIGMVLGKEKTFDGNNHSVSNLTIKKFILDQQLTTYTPDACVGLFAAAYQNSVIKNITVKDVKIVGDEVKNAKWVGALVGFSQGVKEYTNCKSENVTIELLGTSAVRVGGLIGYIEKSHATLEPSVVLTNCSVKNANIIASYSYGGLVGSLYDAVKFDGCKTEGITLGLGNATSNYGYVSKFIGDVTNSTTHNRKVIFKDCTTEDLTDSEKAALGFDNITMKEGKKYVGGCKYVGIVDYVEQMTLIEEINGESRTLQNGVDFNKYEN